MAQFSFIVLFCEVSRIGFPVVLLLDAYSIDLVTFEEDVLDRVPQVFHEGGSSFAIRYPCVFYILYITY